MVKVDSKHLTKQLPNALKAVSLIIFALSMMGAITLIKKGFEEWGFAGILVSCMSLLICLGIARLIEQNIILLLIAFGDGKISIEESEIVERKERLIPTSAVPCSKCGIKARNYGSENEPLCKTCAGL